MRDECTQIRLYLDVISLLFSSCISILTHLCFSSFICFSLSLSLSLSLSRSFFPGTCDVLDRFAQNHRLQSVASLRRWKYLGISSALAETLVDHGCGGIEELAADMSQGGGGVGVGVAAGVQTATAAGEGIHVGAASLTCSDSPTSPASPTFSPGGETQCLSSDEAEEAEEAEEVEEAKEERRWGHLLSPSQQTAVALHSDLCRRMPRAEAGQIFQRTRAAALRVYPDCEAVACGSYRRGRSPDCGSMVVLITHRRWDTLEHCPFVTPLLDALAEEDNFICCEMDGGLRSGPTWAAAGVKGRGREASGDEARDASREGKEGPNRRRNIPLQLPLSDGDTSTTSTITGSGGGGGGESGGGDNVVSLSSAPSAVLVPRRSFAGVCRLPFDQGLPHTGVHRRLTIHVCPYPEAPFQLLKETGPFYFWDSMRRWATNCVGWTLTRKDLSRPPKRDSSGSADPRYNVLEERDIFRNLQLAFREPHDRV